MNDSLEERLDTMKDQLSYLMSEVANLKAALSAAGVHPYGSKADFLRNVDINADALVELTAKNKEEK